MKIGHQVHRWPCVSNEDRFDDVNEEKPVTSISSSTMVEEAIPITTMDENVASAFQTMDFASSTGSNDIWTSEFDGRCASTGSSVGVVLISPQGEIFSYSFKFQLDNTNNMWDMKL